MGKRLIFGGAFDPPHIEHVRLAEAAMKELGIDKLVIVPTYLPPHKDEGFLSFEDRCELIRAAFSGFDFEIDDIELRRREDNYSYKVLPILKEKYGDIVYLIGGDSLVNFHSWRKPEEIAKICPIAVSGREGFDDSGAIERVRRQFGAELIPLEFKGRDVSSSEIRARLLLLEDSAELPPPVSETIKNRGFFRDYADYVKKVAEFESEELFAHSKAVVMRSVDFNSKHNLKQNFKKVFIAGLLHDNAKQRPSIDGLNVPEDAIGTPVLHQFLGAEKARRDFGIEDKEILDAIRYHTTARADMTMLEKLIYTGDSLSDDRDYAPIPSLREIAKRDFDEGFKATLKYTCDKISAKGGAIYPLTLEAYRFYILNN